MTLSDRWHRLWRFEYWPFWAFYLPVWFAWPFMAIRGRSLVFFTASNPFIPLGGCLEESKSEILRQLPKAYLPDWKLVSTVADCDALNFSWPLVAKPDVGERGDNVAIVRDLSALKDYAHKLKRPFIVQEYLSSNCEAGVMVVRLPDTNQVIVTSIVTKGYLQVTGDGKQTIAALIEALPRARFQWLRLKSLGLDDKRVPANGEIVLLEPIGNHKRGTTFIGGQHLRNAAVQATVEKIVADVPGFYFGRFDLKAPSLEAFARGEGWKIMELNGAFSEPGHIYDPHEKLWRAWRDLVYHWWMLAVVSGQNIRRGKNAGGFWEFMRVWKAYRHRDLA
jgi:hypothetical protein